MKLTVYLRFKVLLLWIELVLLVLFQILGW